MNNGCCSKCQAKATKKKKKKKNSKKIKEESDEKDVKQKQKVSENENPKTDSNEEKGSHVTLDQKDKKKKNNNNILTWRHSSIKKEKGGGKNLSSEKNDVNPPDYTARSMTYHGGPNFSNLWPQSAAPRGFYPSFSMPMYGPYGGGGLIQPYQSMPRPTMFDGVHISPYPPMAAAAPPPYWQTRPSIDTNPMTHYTSYADNYSYCFI